MLRQDFSTNLDGQPVTMFLINAEIFGWGRLKVALTPMKFVHFALFPQRYRSLAGKRSNNNFKFTASHTWKYVEVCV